MNPSVKDAVCSACLRPVNVPAETLAEACEGRSPTTIYASDALAFPGIGLGKINATCATCGKATVPIAVDPDVAAMLARYPGD